MPRNVLNPLFNHAAQSRDMNNSFRMMQIRNRAVLHWFNSPHAIRTNSKFRIPNTNQHFTSGDRADAKLEWTGSPGFTCPRDKVVNTEIDVEDVNSIR
jgi:hypothetical protein